ncbi:MAG: helix-turn-helix transcriptional regulator [Candidatus Aminicenantes bacterium]|nr:helix-turn-helix transcriptional regulator [Candidatus Aminicenantes bacterium]
MKAVNIASYILFAGVAAASVREATRLLRRYPGRALRSYRDALFGFFGSAVLGIIGNYILQELLYPQGLPGKAHATAAWVFSLLALPLWILALDAFADAFLAWAGKKYPLAWRIAYYAAQAVFVGSFLAAGPRIFDGSVSGGANVASGLAAVLDAANRLYPAVLAAAFALILGRKSSSSEPKGLTVFALLYAVLFFLGFVLLRVLSPGPGLRAFQSAFAFLIHPLPLFVLGRALKRGGPSGSSEANAAGTAAAALARFGISERETEIVRLLLEGKTYREIESELFISIKTVKTHVYNIYRKTGVKSRWQLMTLLRDGRTDKPESLV